MFNNEGHSTKCVRRKRNKRERQAVELEKDSDFIDAVILLIGIVAGCGVGWAVVELFSAFIKQF